LPCYAFAGTVVEPSRLYQVKDVLEYLEHGVKLPEVNSLAFWLSLESAEWRMGICQGRLVGSTHLIALVSIPCVLPLQETMKEYRLMLQSEYRGFIWLAHVTISLRLTLAAVAAASPKHGRLHLPGSMLLCRRDTPIDVYLLLAALAGEAERVSELLVDGADPSCTDPDGRTALQLTRYIEVRKVLEAAKADGSSSGGSSSD
jgi:hypothetical protein